MLVSTKSPALTISHNLECDVTLWCDAKQSLQFYVSLLRTAAAAVTMEEAMPDLLSPFC
jgi:hypothetical protein